MRTEIGKHTNPKLILKGKQVCIIRIALVGEIKEPKKWTRHKIE
jgi:hypothetical protein